MSNSDHKLLSRLSPPLAETRNVPHPCSDTPTPTPALPQIPCYLFARTETTKYWLFVSLVCVLLTCIRSRTLTYLCTYLQGPGVVRSAALGWTGALSAANGLRMMGFLRMSHVFALMSSLASFEVGNYQNAKRETTTICGLCKLIRIQNLTELHHKSCCHISWGDLCKTFFLIGMLKMRLFHPFWQLSDQCKGKTVEQDWWRL